MKNGLRDGAISFRNLLRERRERRALYGKAHYWDGRAKERIGLARSLWPSNAYNLLWDERQQTVLGRALGDVAGLRVLDVGCGTGRMTRHLARLGAQVVGVDFSRETAELAAAETREAGLEDRTRFELANVLEGFDGLGRFDRAVVVGCLAAACTSELELGRALTNLRAALVEGGELVLLEPMHTSPLLRRVLSLHPDGWIAAARSAGFTPTRRDAMGFLPLRLVASVREAPLGILRTPFELGERALDATPRLHMLADYTLIVFRAP